MITVPGAGRTPNDVMIIGESPGAVEAEYGEPFIGPSGVEQDWYLSRHRLSTKVWRRNNVIQEYTPGNPDPDKDQIAYWTPKLLKEIHRCSPRLIVAVGRFAARWFLGDDVDLESIHGLPHLAGSHDSSRYNRAPGNCTILPIYHPAFGLRNAEMKAIINWDYEQVAATLKDIKLGRTIEYRRDEYAGNEIYLDITGRDLRHFIDIEDGVIGLDTEGTPSSPWSVQVSDRPGVGYTVRCSRDDFQYAVDFLREVVASGVKIVMHSTYDLEMCREMGLDLFDAKIHDTMYNAYLLRLEPQGLKPLSYRWCGMEMKSWEEMTSVLGIKLQVDYLEEVLSLDIPKPEPMLEYSNDGTVRLKQPQHVHRRAESILRDIAIGKTDKDGNPTDPIDRWMKKIPKQLRSPVEDTIGEMPIGSVGAVYNIDPESATTYACRDPDATLRLYYKIKDKVPHDLMNDGNEILPVFEEMQATGMPANRPYFQSLHDEMWDEMVILQSRISHNYFDDRPFNPKSNPHVATLLRRRGLIAAKKTKTGKPSTGKDSIEHLRALDDAVELVFQWRERQHVKDMFCGVYLDIIPEGEIVYPVRCKLNTTRVHTRRLSSVKPNLLAVPNRTELGRRVRHGYQCPDGMVFGSWDLSQIEMRLLASLSGDKLLCRLFNDDRDIHRETAALIFDIPLDEVDDREHRRPAKDIAYGICYGQQEQGLLGSIREIGLTIGDGPGEWNLERCREVKDRWLEIYTGVAKYIRETIELTSREGVIHDIWGMPRYVPAIWSRNAKEAAEAGRQAFNHTIQGGAQGMLQKSIIWLKPRIRKLQLEGFNINWQPQQHDELLFTFDEYLWGVMDEMVTEALTKHCGVELKVPVLSNGSTSKTWGGLK